VRGPPAILALEDGSVYRGVGFGALNRETEGEVVFTTAMTGYQEILTDPSFCGQIVTMTYPLIGNYGVNPEDVESDRIWARAFVLRELAKTPSSHLARGRLEDWMEEQGVLGIEGVDTRALTRRIRVEGAMRGALSASEADPGVLVDRARAAPRMLGRDLVREVTRGRVEGWEEGLTSLGTPFGAGSPRPPEPTFRIVAVDYGVKRNILRNLVQAGFEVTVAPGDSRADEILALEPDGVFLSNGPGDPAAVGYAVDCVRSLLGRVPLFGICLGHQIMSLAFGAKTFKLKFGHRGANQPVQDLATGRVEVTAQNHGFAVDPEIFADGEVELTHVNLNDSTVEGVRHLAHPAFSVQYHPEASPGPHDATHLFDRFRRLISDARGEGQGFKLP
jgi:carbamoyl-phosphate synthase small subunit